MEAEEQEETFEQSLRAYERNRTRQISWCFIGLILVVSLALFVVALFLGIGSVYNLQQPAPVLQPVTIE